MATLREAQLAYDNQLPDDDYDDEHHYTGEIEIDGILFDFDFGTLEQVTMPGDMFDANIDRTALIRQADAIALELWIAERKEMINDY